MKEVKLQKYPAYKNSGVEWLGEIPEHWDAVSLGSILELKSDKNHPDYEVLSVYREYGVIKKDSRDDNHNATSLDTSNYKAVEPGDLVVNKMKAWQGSMGVSPHKGIVSPAYITCRVNSEKIHPEYLHQLLRCDLYIGEYNRLSYGVRVGQWDMHYEDFKHITTTIPPIAEQTSIANFLDIKTAQIESAISIKQKQIELLKERRQILIHRAVTRGLNPDVKLKDSGVEWIGEIPEHWEVLANKYIFCIKKNLVGKNSNNYVLLSLTLNGVIKRDMINPQGKFPTEFDTYQEVKKGDFVFCLFDVEETPRTVGLSEDDGMITGAYTVMECDIKFDKEFIYYFFLNLDIDKKLKPLYTGLRNTISKDNFNSFKTLIPPIEEQRVISGFIKDLNEKISTSISLKEKEIEKLKEYKSVLINEAVSGKIKIG